MTFIETVIRMKRPHDTDPFANLPRHKPSRLAYHLLMLSTALATGAIALSLHWNADENFKYAGEEDNYTTTTFQNIETDGDRRIQHIVKMMRESREGEQLYQFASKHNLRFQWESSQDNAGSYSNGTITLDSRLSNISIVYALVHEINHGWQDKLLNAQDLQGDPQFTWQMAQLREVSACAYSAHFSAQYTEQTGRKFSSYKNVFGGKTAYNYTKIGAMNRDYFANAVLPCFDEIKKNDRYIVNHLNIARLKFHIALTFNSLVKISDARSRLHSMPYTPPAVTNPFTLPPRSERARMMAGLFTPTLNPEDIPPELNPEDTEGVLSFMEQETTPKDVMINEILNDLQGGFEELAKDTAAVENKAYEQNQHYLPPKNHVLVP